MESKCKPEMKDKIFTFKLTFKIDGEHPLYDYEERVAKAELVMFMMEVLDKDPMLGFDIEAI